MEVQFPKGTGGFLNPEIVVRGFGLREGIEVADFGSGAGYFAIPMASIVGPQGKVNAIDILPEQLSAVKSRADVFKIRNIALIQGDLEKEGGSKLKEDSQDCVLVANLLFQVRDRIAPIREARRVLKPGGKLIVIDWRGDSYFGPPKDGRVTIPEIKKMIEGVGFTFEKEFMPDAFHWGMMFRK